MANVSVGLKALETSLSIPTITTVNNSWAEVPTIGAYSEGVRNLESGKRITLRSGDGTPLYPVSASEEELKDMYADLAMTVFVQEQKIRELEEKINQLISK